MKTHLIVWKNINETGIPIIDEQHRGIVSTINSLFYFMRKQRGSYIIAPTIAMLEQYTKVHFLTEESLLELTGYPEMDEHKELHRALIDKMFSISLMSKKTDDPTELLDFLKSWWTGHINMNDKLYTSFVLRELRNLGEL